MNRRRKMKWIKPTPFMLAWSHNGMRYKVKMWARVGGGLLTDCARFIARQNEANT